MRTDSNRSKTSHTWAAAAIVTRGSCCEAAKALKDRRFLATECPMLPLKDCSHPTNCTCTYKKYEDRRAGPRRENEDTGLRRYVEPAQDRRAGRGRRRGDEF